MTVNNILELFKVIVDSPYIIIASVLVLFVYHFVYKDIIEMRSLVKRAKYNLIYYANVQPNIEPTFKEFINGKEITDTSKELRVIASRLIAQRDITLFYWLFSFLQVVPSHNEIKEVSREFMKWSNLMTHTEKEDMRNNCREKIAKLLGMKLDL